MTMDESARACMIQSLSASLMAARKLLGLKRSCMASRLGMDAETLSDIEAGRRSLGGMGYISLAAFLDDYFSRRKEDDVTESLARRMLDADFDDSDLPEYFTRNLSRIFRGMTFLQRWFATFEDDIHQLCIGDDEEFSDGDLEFAAANYNIFLDETAAADRNFHRFEERIEPFLAKEDSQACLFIARTSLERLSDEAVSGLTENGLVHVFDSGSSLPEIFSDNPSKRFILVTRSEKLAQEILHLPGQHERKAPVLAAYITPEASLALHGDDYIPPEDTGNDPENDIFPEEPEITDELS